jgi:predicted aminopeptidase
VTLQILRIYKWIIVGQSLWLSACANLPYYAQAVDGHFEVLRRSQPISKVIADPGIDPKLRNSLQTVVQLREFANRELNLPDNGSYTNYADLGRPYVVWNVFASPELSLKLKEWCFIQAGCVNYRGFFSQAKAERYAEELRNQGYDVHVGGVRAYSTLGWFRDPVLNTFIGYSEMNLARLIFHELAHQVIYVQGDTVFNESFATAVEQEGVRRWFENNGSVKEQAEFYVRQEREVIFTRLIFKYRERLKELFDLSISDTEKRLQKAHIFEELREEFLHLKTSKPELSSYDAWFALPMNNALLATVSIYTQLLPAFQAILQQHGGNMENFFDAIKKISKLSKNKRNLWLQKAAERHHQWTLSER